MTYVAQALKPRSRDRTTLALVLRQFAIVASLCGCLSIFVCNVLPPLCHLRLCSWPPADQGPLNGAKRRPVLAALDAAIFVGGACATTYFTIDALGFNAN